MVLIALAIVFAGIGAMSLSSSDSSDASATSSSASAAPSTTPAAQQNSAKPSTTAPLAPTTTAAAPPTTTAPITTTVPPAPTTTAAPAGIDKTVPVRVLNNGTIAGLAKKTGDQLSADGFNVTEVGNYPNGVIQKTTVYYGSSPKEQALAQAIAAELGCAAVPRFPGIADSPSGVIVIVTDN
ncbi:LytR family transcriptional regulator [Nocardia yunnanensis]|uniref:LytR family transcriptional regulator n=2 Tax=Nocardia yunnanensis TaxID=2382165 RepID=A0A386ZQV0_9NOCA|nr:LytR family transcriptional regulator [Nocardia yunnanensis]